MRHLILKILIGLTLILPPEGGDVAGAVGSMIGR